MKTTDTITVEQTILDVLKYHFTHSSLHSKLQEVAKDINDRLPVPSPKAITVDGEKGDFRCECNRTVCQNTNATFYNYSTQKYYCGECADLINEVNRVDAMRLY